MIYLFCKRPSESATAIVAALRERGEAARKGSKPPHGAVVINWGQSGNYPFLNGNLVNHKLRQLQVLNAAGVPVPGHTALDRPDGWYARRWHHQEADDLLANLEVGDYYVEPIQTTEEYRVHVFKGHSIRAGKKVPRVENPHPTFRSWTGGWRLSYTGSRRRVREMAFKAVEALGYDFGAVDLAVRTNGQLVVWEVNSAPGLEGGTITAYTEAILAHANQAGS